MNMFCNQCQETVHNTGCVKRGVCGKDERVANLQQALIFSLIGISRFAENLDAKAHRKYGSFIIKALFSTITNANFDEKRIMELIHQALNLKEAAHKNNSSMSSAALSNPMAWSPVTDADVLAKANEKDLHIYSKDPDLQSLKTILLFGLKGISAYTDHAAVLGFYDDAIFSFIIKGLAALDREISADGLTALVLEAGSAAVKAMQLLDKANTETYGNPVISEVNIGVRHNPGILISGHDLKDMAELLQQSEGTGIDVYTHSEMLPAHYYPAFKKFKHLAGNYGGSWWKQNKEFESFNGPILMTTNCITPVKDSYKNRIFTTGMAGYPGVTHITEEKAGKPKDFSAIINLAKTCKNPTPIEQGSIIGGFAHNQVLALADKVVSAVKSGAIKRFVVMAGCDGRQSSRTYFEEVAQNLPHDTVILTAGCAKYRYNKLKLGDIGGIPRVLDAGQCNDSYSLAVIALKLKEVFQLPDINDLPLSFDIAWYEQKAVAVLLALLYLGFKNIRLGPTLPDFFSPNVAGILALKFGIKRIDNAGTDIESMMKGEKMTAVKT